MYRDTKIAVIIAAAGSGARMNTSLPKQFLEIDGKPMLVKTTLEFHKNEHIDYIIVVTNPKYRTQCEKMLKESGINATVVNGGKERQNSVYEGLKNLPEDANYILVHDAARPFVAQNLINETIYAVSEKKAVVCAVSVKDTIRMKTGKENSVTTDRNLMYAVQTPQAFEKSLLLKAYEQAFFEEFYGTDDSALVERAGHAVHIIVGADDNIKITTKEDMPMNCETRIGTGFDVHRFSENRKLILGGVEIPFEKGLLGHSDADVLVHAIIDALLGACSSGDIGKHFPDSDTKYKGIPSLLLLKEAANMVRAKGYDIGNIDTTIIAEHPKISPYIDEMAEKITQALNIEKNKVNIKGTTTERLGFIGREEGMAAQAVCILRRTSDYIMQA
jgi:2-C-methyl-D-erythritol 4-phosphate cytidylyltransferase/2-C-methyl-D-erythritol 2,4-cyclodiphosphate synthase